MHYRKKLFFFFFKKNELRASETIFFPSSAPAPQGAKAIWNRATLNMSYDLIIIGWLKDQIWSRHLEGPKILTCGLDTNKQHACMHDLL